MTPSGQNARGNHVLTTTIGAYPKPSDAPVPLWTEMGPGRRHAPTKVYDPLVERQSVDTRQTLDAMTIDAVREQVSLGIDIPTDGEIRREHYIYYHCRHLSGIDFGDLTEQTMRDGSWTALVPTVRGPIGAGEPFLPDDWRTAQSATDRPVKMTVPGPLTITDSIADGYFGDRARLARALADALNIEIRRLADAGCTWIQIDEPLFAREVGAALEFGIECLERCFSGTPSTVRRAVHICCGYPNGLDQPDPPKADAASYMQLAEALDAAAIDAVSIEDAHRRNDLQLLEKYTRTIVILGIVDIAASRVESVDEMRDHLRRASNHIDCHRLIAAPDCGLALLPRELVAAKLRNMAEAAHNLGAG